MRRIKRCLLFVVFISAGVFAQEKQEGHTNTNKFKQLYDEFSTPNMYRAASGAPGAAYYQQQADYKMDITLDDVNVDFNTNGIVNLTLGGQQTTVNLNDYLEQALSQIDTQQIEQDTGVNVGDFLDMLF